MPKYEDLLAMLTWRANQVEGSLLIGHLSVEGLPYEKIPRRHEKAVTEFRRYNTPDRMRCLVRFHRENPNPKATFAGLLGFKADPIPAWAVICTKSGGILANSKTMDEDIYETSPQADAVGLDTYKPNTGLVMWNGTMEAVPCGTYDGPEGGAEYEMRYRGTFRPLTDDEAIAVAQGTLTP